MYLLEWTCWFMSMSSGRTCNSDSNFVPIICDPRVYHRPVECNPAIQYIRGARRGVDPPHSRWTPGLIVLPCPSELLLPDSVNIAVCSERVWCNECDQQRATHKR